jgi:hypothetical protein
MGLAEDHPRTHQMYTRSDSLRSPAVSPMSSVNAETTKSKTMLDSDNKNEELGEVKRVPTEKNVLSEKFAEDIK